MTETFIDWFQILSKHLGSEGFKHIKSKFFFRLFFRKGSSKCQKSVIKINYFQVIGSAPPCLFNFCLFLTHSLKKYQPNGARDTHSMPACLQNSNLQSGGPKMTEGVWNGWYLSPLPVL